MVVPETYLNDVPVPPEEGEQLARIKLSVEVISILELSEVDAIMTLQYREERINVYTWLRESFSWSCLTLVLPGPDWVLRNPIFCN